MANTFKIINLSVIVVRRKKQQIYKLFLNDIRDEKYTVLSKESQRTFRTLLGSEQIRNSYLN